MSKKSKMIQANLLAENRYLKGRVISESDTQNYFNTLAEALDYARERAKERGYEMDEEDIWTYFGTGGVPYGTTKSHNIQLLVNGEVPMNPKTGKPLNRSWHITIYRMESGKYEMVSYPTF